MEYSNIQSHNTRTSQNKLNAQKSANTRIFDREMSDINISNRKLNPLNRLDIERDEFLKNSLKDDEDDIDFNEFRNPNFNNQINKMQKQAPTQENNNTRIPMRPTYNINQPIYDFERSGINSRSSLKDISSFNPHSNLADIDTDTKLSDNLQNNMMCINGNNNYGLFLFENMLQIMNNAFVFSPFLIYTIFSALYIASDKNTEIELKNYFSFPRNDIIAEGLKDLLLPNLNMGNCIIFSDEIDYDQSFCNNVNMFTKIRKVNKRNAQKEAVDINMIIEKMSGLTKKSISTENILNSNVILLNYANIHPTWTSYFSKTFKDNNFEFMAAYNQTFGYYEQPNLQVLEMTSTDNLCFGIIYGDIDFNEKTYKMITSSLKPTILEEVRIPKLKLQTKLRYTNILKETDLKTVFLDLNVPYLFNSECEISDCLQNIEFTLSEKSVQTKKMVGFKTTKKFIVTKSFRFYLRNVNNCIILLGTY
jgi:hypothetical protein